MPPAVPTPEVALNFNWNELIVMVEFCSYRNVFIILVLLFFFFDCKLYWMETDLDTV